MTEKAGKQGKTGKKRGRKPANPYFNNKDKQLRCEVEREYYEDIEVTDPETGEKKILKNVQIQRFKSPYQQGKAILGSSETILTRAERINDANDDDDTMIDED